MSLGVVGRKVGMTRVFDDAGLSVAVTVIEVLPNRVTQVKSLEVDGYEALQVTTGARRASRVTSAAAGHFAKAGVEAGRGMWEFRVAGDVLSQYVPGAEISVEFFEVGQAVDVTGTSIGKGFQGTVKRHNFHMQDATHGNSRSHRVPGSIGQRQTPGRVWKGKKMSGHMGGERVTAQNLTVVRIDAGRGLLLVKGAVPGSEGGDLIVRPSMKAKASSKNGGAK